MPNNQAPINRTNISNNNNNNNGYNVNRPTLTTQVGLLLKQFNGIDGYWKHTDNSNLQYIGNKREKIIQLISGSISEEINLINNADHKITPELQTHFQNTLDYFAKHISTPSSEQGPIVCSEVVLVKLYGNPIVINLPYTPQRAATNNNNIIVNTHIAINPVLNNQEPMLRNAQLIKYLGDAKNNLWMLGSSGKTVSSLKLSESDARRLQAYLTNVVDESNLSDDIKNKIKPMLNYKPMPTSGMGSDGMGYIMMAENVLNLLFGPYTAVARFEGYAPSTEQQNNVSKKPVLIPLIETISSDWIERYTKKFDELYQLLESSIKNTDTASRIDTMLDLIIMICDESYTLAYISKEKIVAEKFDVDTCNKVIKDFRDCLEGSFILDENFKGKKIKKSDQLRTETLSYLRQQRLKLQDDKKTLDRKKMIENIAESYKVLQNQESISTLSLEQDQEINRLYEAIEDITLKTNQLRFENEQFAQLDDSIENYVSPNDSSDSFDTDEFALAIEASLSADMLNFNDDSDKDHIISSSMSNQYSLNSVIENDVIANNFHHDLEKDTTLTTKKRLLHSTSDNHSLFSAKKMKYEDSIKGEAPVQLAFNVTPSPKPKNTLRMAATGLHLWEHPTKQSSDASNDDVEFSNTITLSD